MLAAKISARIRSLIAKLDAMVVAEIEFGQIAMQMLLVAMLVHATHSALEDREEAFR